MSATDHAPVRRRVTRIGEIDGLRGIALTLVVVFHLFGHGRVSGGVDVFLLVSGFLLVLSLGSAVRDGRPLGVVARWGRTFSRLAPPAALVLGAVVVLSYVLLPQAARPQTLAEVVSAALYVENWQLIASQLAYGAAGPETSPVQHFWSLSVQAQFFLVFPLIVALLVRALRTRESRIRAFWGTLILATAASFAYAWWYSGQRPQAAYFSTFARFWEIGLGGLVAGLHLRGWSLPAGLKPFAGWAGLTAVVGSGFLVDGAAHYPGPLALIPTLGAVLVLTSAGSRSPASASWLLRSRPLHALDSISYGLYLWHWPILIAFLSWRGRESGDVGWRGAVAILALSVVAAVVTRVLFRRPIRWGTASTKRSIAFALACVTVAAVPAGALHVDARAGDAVALDPCAGAASLDPDRPECHGFDGDGTLLPDLATLRYDNAEREECFATSETSEMRLCALGDEDAEVRLFAVGDSHLAALTDVFEHIAEQRGWRIDLVTRGWCTWSDDDIAPAGRPAGEQRQCREWREQVGDQLSDSTYDGIVVSNSSRAPIAVPDGADETLFRAEAQLVAWGERPNGTPLIALRDNPIFVGASTNCLDDEQAALAGECALPREQVLWDDGTELAVAHDPHAHLVDLTDYMCGVEVCDMVVGGVYVTRDGGHLSRTFAETLAPYLERELAALIG